MKLEAVIEKIQPLDQTAMQKAHTRQDTLPKPQGSLGRLEELSIQLAGIMGKPIPAIKDKVITTRIAPQLARSKAISVFRPGAINSPKMTNCFASWRK